MLVKDPGTRPTLSEMLTDHELLRATRRYAWFASRLGRAVVLHRSKGLSLGSTWGPKI